LIAGLIGYAHWVNAEVGLGTGSGSPKKLRAPDVGFSGGLV